MEKWLKNYLNEDEKLILFPSKRKLKIEAMFYIASKIDDGVKYTEKEINGAINKICCFNDAASNTYYIETETEKYILKHPCNNEINNPDIEVRICEFLIEKGIPVSEFIKNKEGSYSTYIEGEYITCR